MFGCLLLIFLFPDIIVSILKVAYVDLCEIELDIVKIIYLYVAVHIDLRK